MAKQSSKALESTDPREKVPETGTKQKETVYLVKSAFRDISDFTEEYNVGDDVSHFDNARIEKLLSQDLIVAQ